MRSVVICLSVLFLSAVVVPAATLYVRFGARGKGNGSDWANAYPALPETLVRGNTYYIADGTYSGVIFHAPESGQTLITVKKATALDHGTNTGWYNAYGDGEARFTDTLAFASGYWLLDGQTGGGDGSWTTGFGFHVVRGAGSPVIYKAPNANFITLKHMNIEGDYGDGDGTGNANDGICLAQGNNITVSYCYIHDVGRCLFFGRADFVTIDHCYGGAFESTSNEHSEIASIWDTDGDGIGPHNWTVRHSIWTHLEGTGGFMMDGAALTIDDCVFYQLNQAGGGNGAIGTWTASKLVGLTISNTSFINLHYPAVGILNGDDTGTFYNNTVTNSFIGPTFSRLLHDYNSYGAVLDGAPIDAHPVVQSNPNDFGLRKSGVGNISTRGFVGTGNDTLIAGFIVNNSGDNSRCRVVVRAIGPSLTQSKVAGALPNPSLSLFDNRGRLIASNDNWQQGSNAALIQSAGLAPKIPSESAVLAQLSPGGYTAVIRGQNGATGVALAEVYNLGSDGYAKLANVSSRGQVKLGDQVLIGGFIVSGNFSHKIIARAVGPSLATAGITNALADPTLELLNSQGLRISFNDNWMTTRYPVEATGIPPADTHESAIVRTLPPGGYTLIVRGKNGSTGVALVEAYVVD